MVWFRKKKEGSRNSVPGTGDKIAKALARGISIVQTKWAAWMNRQMAALSLRSQKVVFVIWAIVMFVSSTYIIVNSLNDSPQESNAKRVMKLPRVKLQQPTPSSIIVSDRMYQRFQAFKNKMDSLGRTQEGRMSRDSLLKTRPGLLDSIKMVEKLYGNKH